MLELAQHIQVFLHKHDRPPVSLYEEMVERQRAEERRERERKEKERQLSRIKEEEQVQQFVVEVSDKVGGAAYELGMKLHVCTHVSVDISVLPKQNSRYDRRA